MRLIATLPLLASRAALAAALVFAVALSGCAAPPEAATPASAAPVHEEFVRIAAGATALTGRLFKPVSTAMATERRPAIVLLHGCSGMFDARGKLTLRHRDWAERFARWGFVALLVDSFSPRGITSICELKERPIHPWKERTADAYAALHYLAARRDVDPGTVLVLGWSHGGSTVMSVVRQQAPGRQPAGPHFKAAIAFYPGCSLPLRQPSYRSAVPLLILHGAADDWTPASACVALESKLKGIQPEARTIVYPDAHHAFDAPTGTVHFRPNVYNPTAPSERGAHVGRHPAARLASISDVRQFIEKQLQ